MIINILGTGAIGGFYGAQLSHKYTVNFLARSNYQAIKSNGLEVKSILGDIKLEKPNIYQEIKDLPKADYSILTCKTSANQFFYNQIAQTLKPEGSFVLIQNGIGEEAKFAKYLAQEIIGCSAFISSFLTAPNCITHQEFGSLAAGVFEGTNQSAAISESLKTFASLFEHMDIDFMLSDNLPELRWKKLIWNVMFNGLCVLYDCTTDIVCQTPEYQARGKALMLEIQQAAKSYGVNIADEFIEKMLTSHQNSAYTPSMYLDYQEKRVMEIDSIYLAPIKLAEQNGIELVEMKKVYQELSALTI